MMATKTFNTASRQCTSRGIRLWEQSSYPPPSQVIEHVESWNVSGLQAIAQMFKPGNPPAASG